MLTTILNNLPVPKFVVIQDSVELQGSDVLMSIVKTHYELKKHVIHLFCFETCPERMRYKFFGNEVNVYDYLTDTNGWINKANCVNFLEFIEKQKLQGIIIIDSLSHVILEHGLSLVYKALNKLTNQKDVIQITTLLHTDTLQNKVETLKFLEHISTLKLSLLLVGTSTRVEYRYKKSGGKIVKKIEEYYFDDHILRTRALEKIDKSKILGPIQAEQLPENLSTFKISLDENEKKSRKGLTLPYTAKTNIEQSSQPGGNVIYNLDDEDDWDDEDPDDDLDI